MVKSRVQRMERQVKRLPMGRDTIVFDLYSGSTLIKVITYQPDGTTTTERIADDISRPVFKENGDGEAKEAKNTPAADPG